MNIVNTYELWYSGLDQPQHILQAVKSQSNLNALSAADNARLAEFFLRIADFDKAIQAKTKAYGLQSHDVSSIRLADNIKHIHVAESATIRSRFFQPELTEQEAADLLFKVELEQELEKIKPRNTDIEIRI